MHTNRNGYPRTIVRALSPSDLDAIRSLVHVHEVEYELGPPEYVDIGVAPRSVGFGIDVWTHTYASDADETTRALRCRRLYDAVRHVVTTALASVDELRNAILWVEPWDGRIERCAATSLEVTIRIEVDELLSSSDGPSDTSAARLTSAVVAALERHGLRPRSRAAAG